jgi:hypothetical protein
MALRWVIGVALLAATLGSAAAYDLGQHAWRDRVLILVSPNHEDPALVAQRGWIEERQDAMRDRDLFVIELLPDAGRAGDQRLSPGAATDLRERLQLERQDRLLLLVGKDGGIKRRAPLDADLTEILLQIDDMPMRRAEMRARKRAESPTTPP